MYVKLLVCILFHDSTVGIGYDNIFYSFIHSSLFVWIKKWEKTIGFLILSFKSTFGTMMDLSFTGSEFSYKCFKGNWQDVLSYECWLKTMKNEPVTRQTQYD